MTAMLEAEKKLYYCLICQKATSCAQVRAGAHGGHILTEFACTQNQTPSDNSLMRMFREKMECARRYRDLLFKGG